jgi:hypothetical protein
MTVNPFLGVGVAAASAGGKKVLVNGLPQPRQHFYKAKFYLECVRGRRAA